MKLSPTLFFLKLHRRLQEKIYPEECRYTGEHGIGEPEGEAGRVSGQQGIQLWAHCVPHSASVKDR